MYVSQSAKSQSQKTKTAKRSNRSQSTFRLPNAAASKPAANTAAVGNVGALGALIAVQETDQVQNEKRQAVSKAWEVLDILDELKANLLLGEVSSSSLQKLEQMTGGLSPVQNDHKLQNILDAIRLRARVELAKLKFKA